PDRDLLAVLFVLIDRVVILARDRIRQDLVRLADALELVGASTRRILADQREVGLLDGPLVGVTRNSEDLVVALALGITHGGSSFYERVLDGFLHRIDIFDLHAVGDFGRKIATFAEVTT